MAAKPAATEGSFGHSMPFALARGAIFLPRSLHAGVTHHTARRAPSSSNSRGNLSDNAEAPAHYTASRKEQTTTQRCYWFSILVAVLAALTLSAPAAAAGTQIPFKGRSSGVVTTVGFDPVAGILSTHVQGEGQA